MGTIKNHMFKTLTLASLAALSFAAVEVTEDNGACTEDAADVVVGVVEDYCSACDLLEWDEEAGQCCLKNSGWATTAPCGDDEVACALEATDCALAAVDAGLDCIDEDLDRAAECAHASGLATSAVALFAAAIAASL